MITDPIRRFVAVVTVLLTLVGAASVAPRVYAQLSQTELNSPEVVQAALDQQIGKRVRLKLISGQDLEGQVSRVGRNAVYLSELTGLEFYDATIRIEQVAAVIVRRPR
ncbi:MAG: hypothetical protein ABL961_11775 [Vicinamibacterales bacterium]